MDNNQLLNRLHELKKERNATILAHNYQPPEIQDIADFVGDSLELSIKASHLTEEVVLFCSVHFMGETAKILSPEKTVLMPDKRAGCRMADMITPKNVKDLREKFPDAGFVTYVNSSAAVKAECDITCTSSNAVKIVKNMPQKQIVFVPDGNLGGYVAHFLPEKDIYLYDGFCPVHQDITAEMIREAKKEHPKAAVIIHPECPVELSLAADIAASTSGMLKAAKERSETEFIVATEADMCHRLRKENPDKMFYTLDPLPICPNMKYTTIQKMIDSLENNQYEIYVDQDIAERASIAIKRMIELS